MLLLALLCLASGQLYSVEYIFGTSDCTGEMYSVSSVFVSPPESVCQVSCRVQRCNGCCLMRLLQVRGCVANAQFQTSSYVQCQSTPPSLPANMRCGVDIYSSQDCSGNLEVNACW